MKVFIFLLVVAAGVNGYISSIHYDNNALRNKGTTLTDVDASVKIGTPPAAYAHLFKDDEIAIERLQQLVVMVKRILHVGMHPIPILDPLKKEILGPFNVNNNLVRGQVTLRNVVISGLQSFNVDDLVMRLHYDDQFRVDVNATIPSLTFEAELETNVRVKKIIPIKVKGQISVVISNLKVTGAVGGRPVKLKFASSVLKIIEGKGLGIKMFYKAGKDQIGEAIGNTIIKDTNDVLNSR